MSGVSAGGSGTAASGSSSSGGGNLFQGFAQQFMKDSSLTQSKIFDQLNALMTGGNTDTTSALLSNVLEGSKSAASRTTDQTKQQLAQKGLAGTPFGEQILATTQMQGAQGTANATNQARQQMLQQFLNAFLTQQQGVLGGLASGNVGKQHQTAQSFTGNIGAGG